MGAFHRLRKSQRQTARQREFLDATVHAIAALPDDERADALASLDEMRTAVDAADPPNTPTLITPKIGDPSENQLAPFLAQQRYSRRAC